jgi:ribosomal protein L20A (L18A)
MFYKVYKVYGWKIQTKKHAKIVPTTICVKALNEVQAIQKAKTHIAVGSCKLTLNPFDWAEAKYFSV